ncbi:MAG: septum formation protein Maf [Candidatus Marinimicrobia bacterium]|nr:septum formation protein Maf [Candidatus Neomarinimicrobiota bacterium]
MLLEKLKIPFRVVPSNIQEDYNDNKTPEETVQFISYKKAKFVAENYPKNAVIGTDTIVVLRDEILGKPKDNRDAIKMLTKLSGRSHTVYTGVSIVRKDPQAFQKFYEKTEVTFFPLSTNTVEFYVNNYHTLDKAGAYGIQDWSACFVESIQGCYYNVVGFPLARFFHIINTDSFRKTFGIYNWLGKEEQSP